MMKKHLFLILLIPCLAISQDFTSRVTPSIKSEIILKNGDTLNGYIWMASSAFNPRFKLSEKGKSEKLKYKEIEKITTSPKTKNKRVFQYLSTNYNKYKTFTELISKDTISIYVGCEKNPLKLFYSDFDRTTMQEEALKMRAKTASGFQSGNNLNLPLRKKYAAYYSHNIGIGKSSSYQYYIAKQDSKKLFLVERNKRFLKKSKDFLNNCIPVINKMISKEITLKDLPVFIEYYKSKCYKKIK